MDQGRRRKMSGGDGGIIGESGNVASLPPVEVFHPALNPETPHSAPFQMPSSRMDK